MQLARNKGAIVIGLAGEDSHEFLAGYGAIPVDYTAENLGGRIREASDGPIDAFIDTHGGGYVRLAIEELGVAADRVDTIIVLKQPNNMA